MIHKLEASASSPDRCGGASTSGGGGLFAGPPTEGLEFYTVEQKAEAESGGDGSHLNRNYVRSVSTETSLNPLQLPHHLICTAG